MDELIEQLTPQQALSVIRRLAERGGSVAKAVVSEARKLLAAVDVDETADAVLFALDSIDIQDLWNRSGKSRYGYTSPDEAAVEILEQELEPFLDQVRRYRELGMTDQEKTYCMGVVLGLYRYDRESKSEFHEWAVDLPGDSAGCLLDEWREGGPSLAAIGEMKEFLARSCPEWSNSM
jgi:hypothetical protein